MYIVLYKRTVSNLVLREYYCGQAPATQRVATEPNVSKRNLPNFRTCLAFSTSVASGSKSKAPDRYTSERYIVHRRTPHVFRKHPQSSTEVVAKVTSAKACGLTLVGRDIGWYWHDMFQTSNFEIKSCSKSSAFFVSCSSRAIWMCCSCTWHFQNNTPVRRTQTYTCYHLLSLAITCFHITSLCF